MNSFIYKIIKTEAEYEAALNRLDTIFDAKRGTIEGDEMELLSLLIDNYEKTHFPIDFPDPIEAIKYQMAEKGYRQKDLAQIIGVKSRVSEILNKKRKLTLSMIREISHSLNIPMSILVREY